jgi:hypothetical protein
MVASFWGGSMQRIVGTLCVYAAYLVLLGIFDSKCAAADRRLRVGIVGCDTSHVVEFTKLINDAEATGAAAEVQVTVAYPGGSPDLPASRDRVAGYVAQLRDRSITIVDSLDALVDQCDAILLESVDGRVHYEQFRAIAKGKPVFIDKPAAASLADVIAIFRYGDQTRTPVYSTSPLRFCEAVESLSNEKKFGDMLGCETVSPLKIEPHHPDLFWYGIHGVESLFAIMGRGCETVTCTDSDLSAVAVGKWRDGRIGVYRGLKKGQTLYAFTAYGTNEIAYRSGFSGYQPSVQQICSFLLSGEPPVNREDTIEIFAFMEAADESKRLDGKAVSLHDMIERAEKTATEKAASAVSDSGKREATTP